MSAGGRTMADSTGHGTATRASRGPRPAGVVGMLALVLVVELLVSQAVRLESVGMAIWRADRRSSECADATSAEILCVGDSLVKTGVVPAALEARLDRATYNLATVGNPTPATYFLLRRALAAGARPRAIILDAQSDKLSERGYRACVAAWAGLVGPAEAVELARSDGDPGFFGLYLIHHFLPSIRLRPELRQAIVDHITPAGIEPTTHWPRVVARQERRNRGALLFPPLKAETVDGGNASAAAGPAAAIATPTNLSYLDRTLDLARSQGIWVFLVVTPMHPDLLRTRERLGLESPYLSLVHSASERYENVVVIDGRRVVEDGGVFLDSSQHMD
ncbi:MAG TPA: hypothetical protein VGH33_02555, partial [Isosphaeraceae bacterium]